MTDHNPVSTPKEQAERLTHCVRCGALSDYCAVNNGGCCNECTHGCAAPPMDTKTIRKLAERIALCVHDRQSQKGRDHYLADAVESILRDAFDQKKERIDE